MTTIVEVPLTVAQVNEAVARLSEATPTPGLTQTIAMMEAAKLLAMYHQEKGSK